MEKKSYNNFQQKRKNSHVMQSHLNHIFLNAQKKTGRKFTKMVTMILFDYGIVRNSFFLVDTCTLLLLLFSHSVMSDSGQASLYFTISQSLPKLMSTELTMPSNHLILFCPHLLLPSIFPSIRVFSDESVLTSDSQVKIHLAVYYM